MLYFVSGHDKNAELSACLLKIMAQFSMFFKPFRMNLPEKFSHIKDPHTDAIKI